MWSWWPLSYSVLLKSVCRGKLWCSPGLAAAYCDKQFDILDANLSSILCLAGWTGRVLFWGYGWRASGLVRLLCHGFSPLSKLLWALQASGMGRNFSLLCSLIQYTEKVVVPVRCGSILCKYYCRLGGTCFGLFMATKLVWFLHFVVFLACYSTSGPPWGGKNPTQTTVNFSASFCLWFCVLNLFHLQKATASWVGVWISSSRVKLPLNLGQ